MERLQAAIEKARAQRKTPPNARHASVAKRGRSETRGSASVDALWEDLPEIRLDRRDLRRGRVVTLEPNADGAAYDLLRTRLLQQAQQKGWKTIGFVSPHSGCGKSTSVANLAFSLSRQQDTSSLILDFDLRRRGLTALLGQKPRKGLVDMLKGKSHFSELGLRHAENVAFGLIDQTTKNASEILQSGKTDTVLQTLDDEYQPDLILFDLPPLMATDDNFGFLNKIDAAVIMAAAEQTTMSQIDIAERQVAELTNVMGVVLNQCRFNAGAYGQDYGYY